MILCALALALAFSLTITGHAAQNEEEEKVSWFGQVINYVTNLFGGGEEEEELEPEATETPAPTDTPEPEPEPLKTVEYEIITQDQSFYDGDQLLVSFCYDLVVLHGEGEAVESINRQIDEAYQEYLAERETLVRDVMDAPWLDPDSEYFTPLFYDVASEVTYNTNGIISIAMSADWFLGGVHNWNPYGMTFDLNTGEPMTLAGLFPVTGDDLESALKSITVRYMDENGYVGFRGGSETSYDTLEGYALADFEFYIHDGELVLTYATYILTIGAEGSLVIPTGLMIECGELEAAAREQREELARRQESVEERALYTYIGESISVLTESGLLGIDYVDDYYEGGRYRYFPSIEAGLFFDQWSDDDSVFAIMATGDGLCGWGLRGSMTYPEMLENFTEDIELPEPYYYCNVLDDMDEYAMSIEIEGYILAYTWYDDPYTSPADVVYISPTQ